MLFLINIVQCICFFILVCVVWFVSHTQTHTPLHTIWIPVVAGLEPATSYVAVLGLIHRAIFSASQRNLKRASEGKGLQSEAENTGFFVCFKRLNKVFEQPINVSLVVHDSKVLILQLRFLRWSCVFFLMFISIYFLSVLLTILRGPDRDTQRAGCGPRVVVCPGLI